MTDIFDLITNMGMCITEDFCGLIDDVDPSNKPKLVYTESYFASEFSLNFRELQMPLILNGLDCILYRGKPINYEFITLDTGEVALELSLN